jgi:hypothetical protein
MADHRRMTVDFGRLLVEQLEFYWDVHLRPRLDGLSDEEYLWEPVAGCWSLRQGPDGRWRMDGLDGSPAPEPPPVTTIAWRMMHVGATCLANRASAFFGGDGVPADAPMWDPRLVPSDLPGTAAEAGVFLQHHYERWHAGIAALDAHGMAAPLGPKGGTYARDPMAGLVLHISREVMHHGGEIGVLRDLYRAGLGRSDRV